MREFEIRSAWLPMAFKQMILIPVFWGEWWVPAMGNSYSWADVIGLMSKVVSGRYMDGLNQYGIGRGVVAHSYVYPIDPPPDGFWDAGRNYLFKFAIDQGHITAPRDLDLNLQQPFYSLIVKPGVEHRLDPSGAADTNTGAYHFPFTYEYDDGAENWDGQACWVKADVSAEGTVRRWVHEMAEAYTAGEGEIADMCEQRAPVMVEGVSVPQYWSVADSDCWPPKDRVDQALSRFPFRQSRNARRPRHRP